MDSMLSRAIRRNTTMVLHKSAFAVICGVAIGALASEALHAQAKAPVYSITEVDIANLDAYLKDYVPLAQATIKASGGRTLAAGQNIVALDGAPPLTRVNIIQFDSFDAVRNWRASDQFKAARQIGDKYAKFRAFAVEGLPQ